MIKSDRIIILNYNPVCFLLKFGGDFRKEEYNEPDIDSRG